MSATSSMVVKLKEAGQDFEWYPTTIEMIDVIARHIPNDVTSIMDVGAGDGRVLKWLAEKTNKHATLYSIEKAPLLIEAQPKDIIPVGTELFEQTLSALPVEYLVCNPIYSDFEEWMCKIIAEAFCERAFLIVPTRWSESQLIKKALDKRGATTRGIYTGDFHNAERQARAIIEIVEITFPKTGRGGYRGSVEDRVVNPFDIWFDENVLMFDQAKEFTEPENDVEALARRFGTANVEEMVESYLDEYDRLVKTYQTIFTLDGSLLEEVGVTKHNVCKGLKEKIAGLKIKYWKVLFKRIGAITSRLTTKSSSKLIDKLTARNTVDFTVANAYAIIMWAIKNANHYIDEQLVDLFYELAVFDGVLKYKSNVRTWNKSDWRYNRRLSHHKNDITHYALDYRFVVSVWKAIKNEPYSDYQYPGNLYTNAHDLIADIVAVLATLGFSTDSSNSRDRNWKGGQWQNWYGDHGEILFQVKAYMNGNLHMRFMPSAIRALNIHVARILKWVETEEDVVTEMGYSPAEARKYFRKSIQIPLKNSKLLMAPAEALEEEPEPKPVDTSKSKMAQALKKVQYHQLPEEVTEQMKLL